MGCNLLIESMKKIQQEYLMLLRKYESFDVEEVYSIQNECQIFWLRHKREIDFFLNNYPYNFDTCVFIGGMYLNVASKSLYPFLTFGKKHLVDDPVALLSTNDSKEYFAEYLKFAIADDIDIIQNHGDQVLILPLSYLFVDKALCETSAKNSFWRLFHEEGMNEDEYESKFHSLDEVIECIGEERGRCLFLKYEKTTLKERYLEHLDSLGFPVLDGKDGVMQFYGMCMGLFLQAMVVMIFCTHYWVFPFIRDHSLFGCFCLLMKNMLKQKEFAKLKTSLNKAVVLKLFYGLFVYEELENLDDYLKMLNDSKFETIVFNRMQEENVECCESGSFAKVNTVLIEEMHKRNIPCVV